MKKGKSRNKRKKTRSRLLWIAIVIIGIAAVISAVCVAGMLTTNSIKASFGKLTVSNISDMSLDNIPYRSFCCNKTVFDPTCGAGEYLLTALEMKINLLKNKTNRLVSELNCINQISE